MPRPMQLGAAMGVNRFCGALAAFVMAGLVTALPARASLVVFAGALDNLQVVAPVYQLNPDGSHYVDPVTGSEVVVGSTSTRPDGTPISQAYGARGFATVTLDTVAQSITTDFSWSGLSGVADRAQLHDAPAGVSHLQSPNGRFFHEVITDQYDATGAPVVDAAGNVVSSVSGGYVPCWFDPSAVLCAPSSGHLSDVVYLDSSYFDPAGVFGFADFAALQAAFTTGGMFIDIRTEAYPGGEIRGQLQLATPEPGSLPLLVAALGGLYAVRRRGVNRTGQPA